MKTILKLAGILLALSITVPAFAGGVTSIGSSSTNTIYQGEPYAFLPISNKEIEKVDAIANGKIGFIEIQSENLLQSAGEVRYAYVYGTDTNDVLAKMAAQSFKVRTDDKTAPVILTGSVYDSAWNLLFSGSGQVATIETSTGLVIQKSPIVMQMVWSDPIAFPNVQSARIVHKDDNGYEWTEWLQIGNGGRILSPLSYGETKGRLIVTRYYTSGGPTPNQSIETSYDLETGKQLPTTGITGSPSVALANHLIKSDAGYLPAAALIVSGRMNPPVDPAVDSWTIIAPPSVSFNVTAQAGSKRLCSWSIVVQMQLSADELAPNGIKAWISDPSRKAADGTILELGGIVSAKQVGQDAQITVTWYLDNDVEAPGGSNWHGYILLNKYGKQRPAQPPWDGRG